MSAKMNHVGLHSRRVRAKLEIIYVQPLDTFLEITPAYYYLTVIVNVEQLISLVTVLFRQSVYVLFYTYYIFFTQDLSSIHLICAKN
jgi:hypothetical protein